MNRTTMNLNTNSSSVALVVDDDQSICDIVAAILENEGFTVVTANSGDQALDCFGNHVIDIVFTDICMPGISGLDLLDRISNLDSSVKTIMMTAHGGFDTVLLALQGGAYDFIEKPLEDHNRIVRIARKACSHAKLERDNQELLIKLKASHSKLADANSQLLRVNEQLEQLALTDGLTGLRNRRSIDDTLVKEMARYKRYQFPMSILLIDVDHFKQINDTHGHARGDEVLKLLSGIFLENSRESDSVGRYGGEEFVLILHGTSIDGALVVANRILEQVREPMSVDGEAISITVSIGIASLDGEQQLDDSIEFVRRSDQALYSAKHGGRNCIRIFDHDDLDSTQKARAVG